MSGKNNKGEVMNLNSVEAMSLSKPLGKRNPPSYAPCKIMSLLVIYLGIYELSIPEDAGYWYIAP